MSDDLEKLIAEESIWEPRTAEEAFLNSLVNDATVKEDILPGEPLVYRGGRISYGMPLKETSPYSAIGAPKFQDDKIIEMPLQPWDGVPRARLNNQTKELRKRLNNSEAVMLVVQYRTFSAKSVFGVIWLYLMTKLFGLPKPKKEQKPANGKKVK